MTPLLAGPWGPWVTPPPGITVPTPIPKKGSIKVACTGCQAEIWLGPQQQIVRTRDNGVPVCPTCAFKMAGSNANVVPLAQEGHRYPGLTE